MVRLDDRLGKIKRLFYRQRKIFSPLSEAYYQWHRKLHIEARTRDVRRADVIVNYLGEPFIVELKIWRGNEYNERGEEQMGIHEIAIGDKILLEAVV